MALVSLPEYLLLHSGSTMDDYALPQQRFVPCHALRPVPLVPFSRSRERHKRPQFIDARHMTYPTASLGPHLACE
jgi:hypothetical protein